MKYSTPEKLGIKSEWIKEFIEYMEKTGLCTHDFIIMRHDQIVFENYWAPFHKDYLHRMYSVTKSYVALAIGCLEEEGKISLDDPIIKYFPKEMENQPDENMRNQTIRHMLMMATAKQDKGWFMPRCADRVQRYFDNDNHSKPSGTFWQYDSSGSFVMGALVERVTGKTLMEYLREKILDKIGFSKEAYMLKCPGGHSWGDSSLICKATDLLKTGQFLMKKGNWNGEQLLNEKFVTDATSKLIDNNVSGVDDWRTQGYGYQIWRTFDNSFAFYGMGCQFMVCVPDKDIIMVYNGDNQGIDSAQKMIFDNFYSMIVRKVDREVVEDTGYDELMEYVKTLKLHVVPGKATSKMADKINNVTYKMTDNPMGITKMKFSISGDKGVLYYTNAQGDKELPFGIGENEFSIFPQEGYSDEVGSQASDKMYKCAVSAAWKNDSQFFLKIQIIDTYFGVLHMSVSFRDNKIGVYMEKTAEDFLNEYVGYAGGEMEK